MSAEFVFWFFTSPLGQRQIKENASATTLPILNKSKFEALAIPIPPLAEQTRIVAEVERRLSVVEELEAAVSANLQRASRLRHSILQKAFTGRLVAHDPTDEPASIVLAHIPLKSNGSKKSGSSRSTEHEKATTPELHGFTRRRTRQRDVKARKVSREQNGKLPKMKLLRLKLFNDFNSLSAFDYTFRSSGAAAPSLSPICLVGLNGSGKSNLIEALSEVLCTTELAFFALESDRSKASCVEIALYSGIRAHAAQKCKGGAGPDCKG